MFAFPGQSRRHGFRSLDTGCNHDLGRQIGKLCAKVLISGFVQFDTIALEVLKTQTSNHIETGRMLAQCARENGGLLIDGMQLYDHSPVHAQSILYMSSEVERVLFS